MGGKEDKQMRMLMIGQKITISERIIYCTVGKVGNLYFTLAA